MPRSSRKGYLKLSLVSVPIRGYTANVAASEIRLHQLHSECHSRIRYQKTCPAHGDAFNEEIEKTTLSREELNLTRTLLEAFEKPKFSLAGYKDHYVEELRQLIQAKVEGKELVTPPAEKEPHVINLMDALKKSV